MMSRDIRSFSPRSKRLAEELDLRRLVSEQALKMRKFLKVTHPSGSNFFIPAIEKFV